MPGFPLRVFGAILLAASTPLAAATPPLESESFRIGSEGALCEAQGVMLGEARATLFDRKWALLCADVDRPIGAAFSWKGVSDIEARLGRGRETTLECDAPADAADIAPFATLRRCRDPQSGLAWNSYAAATDGRLHIVEGLAAFDGVLRLTLGNL
ncbi:MAG: CHAT domain-containing protein, partial [Vicinamibacteria bacterium]